MRINMSLLACCALFGGLVGCDSINDGKNSGITVEAVDAITDGDSTGVQFTGTWTMQTEITESSCAGLVGLPEKGDTDDETLPLVHSQGELTPGVNDFGDLWRFKGAIDADGGFQWGTVWEFELGGATVKRIELTTGTMESAETGTDATLTGTAQRRYQVDGLLIDCTATVKLVGERSLLGGGD
jgi:hypothetical protein